MARLMLLSHVLGLGGGALAAWYEQHWTYVVVQLFVQGALLLAWTVFPDAFGQLSPRERDARAAFRESNTLADLISRR